MLCRGTLLSSRYQIDSPLGQGGMGAVYLAEDVHLDNKKVAVKEMFLANLRPQEVQQALRQFQKEAAFLAHLAHPNLVKVTDFFHHFDRHYLVMEYLEGKTLQEMLAERQEPFDWDELAPWVQKLVDVLDYLHNQNPAILFRDLKPSNIMILSDGSLRLIDFGIARAAPCGQKTSTFLQGTGTQGFSPIEQYGGAQPTDPRSDLYSLAATIYYLLSGKLPPDAVARVSQKKTIVPLSELAPTLPSGIEPVLEKALSLAKQERHPSVRAFARALRKRNSGPKTLVTKLDTRQPLKVEIIPAKKPKPRVPATLVAVSLLAILSGFTAQSQGALTNTPRQPAPVEKLSEAVETPEPSAIAQARAGVQPEADSQFLALEIPKEAETLPSKPSPKKTKKKKRTSFSSASFGKASYPKAKKRISPVESLEEPEIESPASSELPPQIQIQKQEPRAESALPPSEPPVEAPPSTTVVVSYPVAPGVSTAIPPVTASSEPEMTIVPAPTASSTSSAPSTSVEPSSSPPAVSSNQGSPAVGVPMSQNPTVGGTGAPTSTPTAQNAPAPAGNQGSAQARGGGQGRGGSGGGRGGGRGGR